MISNSFVDTLNIVPKAFIGEPLFKKIKTGSPLKIPAEMTIGKSYNVNYSMKP